MNENVVNVILQGKENFREQLLLLSDDCKLKECLCRVFENLDFIESTGLISRSLESNVSFSSYYNSRYDALGNIEYFNSSYFNKDKNEQYKNYLLYGCFRNLHNLIGFKYQELGLDFKGFIEWMDEKSFYSDILTFSDMLRKKMDLEIMTTEQESSSKMQFLSDENPYRILFLGHSLEDIENLPARVRLQVIKKLNSPLAVEKIVPLAEGVDHVRDLYDFPLQRIHVGDDYRLSYIRRGDVTAVLGIRLKSGKDIDYTRYDSVAKNANKIYREIDNFSMGVSSDIHKKCVELLQDSYDKARMLV